MIGCVTGPLSCFVFEKNNLSEASSRFGDLSQQFDDRSVDGGERFVDLRQWIVRLSPGDPWDLLPEFLGDVLELFGIKDGGSFAEGSQSGPGDFELALNFL